MSEVIIFLVCKTTLKALIPSADRSTLVTKIRTEMLPPVELKKLLDISINAPFPLLTLTTSIMLVTITP